MTLEELANARMVHALVRKCEYQSRAAINEWQSGWGISMASDAGPPSVIAQRDLIVQLYGLVDDIFSMHFIDLAVRGWGPQTTEDIKSLENALLLAIPDLIESLWDQTTHDLTLPLRKTIRKEAPALCKSLAEKARSTATPPLPAPPDPSATLLREAAEMQPLADPNQAPVQPPTKPASVMSAARAPHHDAADVARFERLTSIASRY